jgi:hypothetical protein
VDQGYGYRTQIGNGSITHSPKVVLLNLHGTPEHPQERRTQDFACWRSLMMPSFGTKMCTDSHGAYAFGCAFKRIKNTSDSRKPSETFGALN